MSDTTDTPVFDPDYAPPTYWERSDPIAAILAGVKGTKRKELIREALERGEEIPEDLLEPNLSQTARNALESMDPQWMGGEYLPDPDAGEVEIACISLNTTTGDVYSVRARPEGGRIHYRMVDEYEDLYDGGGWEVWPKSSKRPLTGEDLVILINTAELCGQHKAAAMETFFEYQDPDPDFYTVESDFYPGLTEYYYQRALAYVEEAAQED
jgi:hypothetical protein